MSTNPTVNDNAPFFDLPNGSVTPNCDNRGKNAKPCPPARTNEAAKHVNPGEVMSETMHARK